MSKSLQDVLVTTCLGCSGANRGGQHRYMPSSSTRDGSRSKLCLSSGTQIYTTSARQLVKLSRSYCELSCPSNNLSSDTRSIESEEDQDYLLQDILLKRYSIVVDDEQTAPANVIERAVDLHALRVTGSSGYQKCVNFLWRGWLVQDENDPSSFVDYKKKANTRYWTHVDPDRMRAPVYQNATQIIFSLIYLGLYTGAINTVNPTGDLDVIEIMLYIFTFGFLCDEFSKLWKVGRYYIGFWNVFNVVLYALLTTSLVTRFIALGHPLEDDDGQRRKYNELSYNFLGMSKVTCPRKWGVLIGF
jgi:hypothetical protein